MPAGEDRAKAVSPKSEGGLLPSRAIATPPASINHAARAQLEGF